MWTYIGQIISFIIFVLILRALLYKPVRKVMRERKEEMEADLRAAEEKRRQAEELRRQAEESKQALELQRDDIITQARAQAEQARKELLEQAEDAAREHLARFRRIMAEEQRDALGKVTDELRETIATVSGSVLKDAGERLIDRGLDRMKSLLDGLADADVRQAQKSLGETDEDIIVRVAGPVSDGQRDQLKSMLNAKFGDGLSLDIKEDESLLAGLEATVGHLHLEAHWRGVIDEALAASKE